MKKLKILSLIIFCILSFQIIFSISDETAYWNCEDNMNDQWNDNNGTVSGMVYNTDIPSFNVSGDGGTKSCQFDGINDKVDVNTQDMKDISGSLSNSVWVKDYSSTNFNTGGEIHATLFGRGQWNSGNFGLRFSNVWNGLNWTLENYDLSPNSIIGNCNFIDGNWHHLVTVYNSSDNYYYAYCDGILVNSISTSGTFPTDTAHLNIGARDNDRWWNGRMDELKLFNRALTPQEVQNLYNCGDHNTCINLIIDVLDIQENYDFQNISITVNVTNNLSTVNLTYKLYNSTNHLILNQTLPIQEVNFTNATKFGVPVYGSDFPNPPFYGSASVERYCYELGYFDFWQGASQVLTVGDAARWLVPSQTWSVGDWGLFIEFFNCSNTLPVTIDLNLDFGIYKISFSATDGIQTTATENFTFAIDGTPPEINITLLNNFTEPIETNYYTNFLPDFFNVTITDNLSGVNISYYLYNGEIIPEILLTPLLQRPVSNISNYTGISFDISGIDVSPRDLFFHEGFWYVTGDTGNSIDQYYENWTYTGTSFDISAEGASPRGLFFHDGFWYVAEAIGDDVNQYYENWTYTGTSFSVSAQDTSPYGIFFRENFWYLSGDAGNDINQYYENWTYTGTSFSISAQDTSPRDLYFQDGYWYLVGDINNQIFQYNETWTYTGTSFSVATEDTNPSGIFFKNNSLFLSGIVSGDIFLYDTVYNRSTFSFDSAGNQSIEIFAQDNAGNNDTKSVSFFVDPFQIFRFNVVNGSSITNFTFFNTLFEGDEARIKLFDIGFGNKTLIFEKQGYNDTPIELTFTNTSNYNLTIVIPLAKIVLRIFDRQTDELLTGTTNIELFGENGFLGSTTTGLLNITDSVFISGEYGIIATHDGYATEIIYFNFTNQEIISLNIFMLSETDPDFGNVVVIARNKFGELIQGALCKANQWKSEQSSYVPVAQGKTNALGRVILNIELTDKLYRFSCSKDGITVTNEERFIQFDLDEEIVIIDILEEDPELDFENVITNVTENIIGDYSFINYDFENTLGDNVIACLKFYRINGVYKSLINQTCQEQPSGTIMSMVNISTSFDIQILATIEIQGTEYDVRSFFHASTSSISQFLHNKGLDKFIMPLFIILAVTLVFLVKIPIFGELVAIGLLWFGVILAPNIWNSRLAFTGTAILILMGYWGYKTK